MATHKKRLCSSRKWAKQFDRALRKASRATVKISVVPNDVVVYGAAVHFGKLQALHLLAPKALRAHVRHQLSNYDELLKSLKTSLRNMGMEAHESGIELLKKKFNQHIDRAYPLLTKALFHHRQTSLMMPDLDAVEPLFYLAEMGVLDDE